MRIFHRIKSLINGYLKKEIFKSIITLVSGSVLSQVIILIVMPFITRIYPKEALSIFFVFSSTVAIFSIIATLEYELAIVLPKSDIWAINLAVLSLVINFFVSTILLLIIVFFKIPLLKFLNCNPTDNWIYMVPPSVFLNGIFQTFNYWFNRFKRFRNISLSKIIRSAFSSTSQLAMAIPAPFGITLIFGQLLGQLAALSTILIDYKKYIQNLIKSVSVRKMFFVAKQYKEIPIFNSTLDVMNSISNQLPIFLITKYFGLANTSYYGLSHRIIATPMGVISEAFGQVFYQKASEIKNAKESLHYFVKKTYASLFKIAVVPFIIMFFLAPFAFKIAFGQSYENAGILTKILIPWLFVMFLNSPITFLITILRKQKQKIIYDFLLLVFRCLSLVIGYKLFNDIYSTIILFSLVGFFFNCFLVFYLLRISKTVNI